MPFLFGIAMFFAAAGESIDVLMDLAFLSAELIFFQIRTTIVAGTLFFYLTATILIWFVDRRRLGYLIILLYMIAVITLIWIAPTIEAVRLYTMPLLLALFILFIVTFITVWYMKRLPDVHGLVMAIGVIIAMFGQVGKIFLAPVSLIWVSEIIDLVGLSVLALGLLIRPGYAKP